MSSESRLYTFSPETKAELRKFRLGTSRADKPQAVVYEIDKTSGEIRRSADAPDVYSDLAELADELPEHAPRFVLLSHPLRLADGRTTVPYAMVYWMPVHCNADVRMRYASARETMHAESQAGRVYDAAETDDVLALEEVLRGNEH